MHVIGTAGHVDHGKSTLVKALTGTDPDRLREEKQRQMTIDLGFAFFQSQDGGEVGIIDVPGHRDFIENMLAGVGGIDAVLLVIAADEGVMPQTREHLAIIDLLKIQAGIVVLTKIDLVDDEEWLSMIENDLRKVLEGTVLASSPLMRVSSVTGDGIESLKAEISHMLTMIPSPRDSGRPRLPVDRVFSVQGFGTVVTGTLTGGSYHTGDIVEILPTRKTGRIRGLQSHNRQESVALPGSRTAINLSGVDLDDVKRGDVIAIPGSYLPTRRIDAKLEILKDASRPLRHNDLIKLFLAASENIGRIRLLGNERIDPGGSGWVQIEFDDLVIADKEDRFIIRRLSPAETLGGGMVVNSAPGRRYKLSDPNVISKLEARLRPSSTEALSNFIEETRFVTKRELESAHKECSSTIDTDLNLLLKGRIVSIPGKSETYYATSSYWSHLTQKLLALLSENYARKPLSVGVTIEEVKSRLGIREEAVRGCVDLWVSEGTIVRKNLFLSLQGHTIKYSPQQTRKLDSFNALLNQNPFVPPNVSEMSDLLGSDLYQSLIDQEFLIQVSHEIAFREQEYRMMLEYTIATCQSGKVLTVAVLRDQFSTSRKYVLAFLEHLDQRGITERDGEGRRLKKTKTKEPADSGIH